jgi:hypothetical protein
MAKMKLTEWSECIGTLLQWEQGGELTFWSSSTWISICLLHCSSLTKLLIATQQQQQQQQHQQHLKSNLVFVRES